MRAIPNDYKTNFDGIPSELKALNQWLVCDVNKIPHSIDGTKASGIGFKTAWTSYEQAKQAVETDSRFKAIGLSLIPENGIVVVDIDDRYEDKDKKIIEVLNAVYTEVSPSDKGIHAFMYGKKNDKACKRPNLEVYDKHFITITGKNISGVKNIIHKQDLIDLICSQLNKSKKETIEDKKETIEDTELSIDESFDYGDIEEKTKKVMNQITTKDDKKYTFLCNEEIKDASTTEFKFCAFLLQYTKDFAVIDTIYNKSLLFERVKSFRKKNGSDFDKWNERIDYKKSTISKALMSIQKGLTLAEIESSITYTIVYTKIDEPKNEKIKGNGLLYTINNNELNAKYKSFEIKHYITNSCVLEKTDKYIVVDSVTRQRLIESIEYKTQIKRVYILDAHKVKVLDKVIENKFDVLVDGSKLGTKNFTYTVNGRLFQDEKGKFFLTPQWHLDKLVYQHKDN